MSDLHAIMLDLHVIMSDLQVIMSDLHVIMLDLHVIMLDVHVYRIVMFTDVQDSTSTHQAPGSAHAVHDHDVHRPGYQRRGL